MKTLTSSVVDSLGSHELVPELGWKVRSLGVDAPIIVGDVIPDEDQPHLIDNGVAAVYTPKDYELAAIMTDSPS